MLRVCVRAQCNRRNVYCTQFFCMLVFGIIFVHFCSKAVDLMKFQRGIPAHGINCVYLISVCLLLTDSKSVCNGPTKIQNLLHVSLVFVGVACKHSVFIRSFHAWIAHSYICDEWNVMLIKWNGMEWNRPCSIFGWTDETATESECLKCYKTGIMKRREMRETHTHTHTYNIHIINSEC